MTEKRVDVVIGGKNLSDKAFDQVKRNAEGLRKKMDEVQSGKGFTDFAVKGLAAVGSIEGGLRVAQALASVMRGDFEGMQQALEAIPFGVGALVRAGRELVETLSGAAAEAERFKKFQEEAASAMQLQRDLTLERIRAAGGDTGLATLGFQKSDAMTKIGDQQTKLNVEIIELEKQLKVLEGSRMGPLDPSAMVADSIRAELEAKRKESSQLGIEAKQTSELFDLRRGAIKRKAVDDDLGDFFGEIESAAAALQESILRTTRLRAEGELEAEALWAEQLQAQEESLNRVARLRAEADLAAEQEWNEQIAAAEGKPGKAGPGGAGGRDAGLRGGVDLDVLGPGFSGLAAAFREEPQKRVERKLEEVVDELKKVNEGMEEDRKDPRHKAAAAPIYISVP